MPNLPSPSVIPGSARPAACQPPGYDAEAAWMVREEIARQDGPHITPLFTLLLEVEAARRGLAPEPWAA